MTIDELLKLSDEVRELRDSEARLRADVPVVRAMLLLACAHLGGKIPYSDGINLSDVARLIERRDLRLMLGSKQIEFWDRQGRQPTSIQQLVAALEESDDD
jgi:hypothetical protein